MATISNLRAGLSCLPIVGPYLALYNIYETQQEIRSHNLITPLTELRYGLLGAAAGFAGLARDKTKVDEIRQEVEEEITKFRNVIPIYEKCYQYSLYGIAGNVLSVATVVGLIAFKILSGVDAVLIVGSYTIQAAALCYIAYRNWQTIQHLQLLR